MKWITILLIIVPISTMANYKYDPSTGNSYNYYTDPTGTTQVNGNNMNHGTNWNTTIESNGNMHGYDSNNNSWNYNSSTGDCVDWLAAHPSATIEDILPLPRQQKLLNPDDLITQLATLSAIEYDRARIAKAKLLNIRPSTLDDLVKALKYSYKENKTPFAEIEPWHEAIDPAALLLEISNTIRCFIICPAETVCAATLWIAMTWFIDVIEIAPLAIITAPEKRCGKSQLLFLLARLVNRPLSASNITPAALFRSIDAWQPTLLIDEADAFMRENEELRGIINCGHTRDSAKIIRVVGDDYTPTTFNVWGAKALAGIGHLPDTIMDRAITFELRRKLTNEKTI